MCGSATYVATALRQGTQQVYIECVSSQVCIELKHAFTCILLSKFVASAYIELKTSHQESSTTGHKCIDAYRFLA